MAGHPHLEQTAPVPAPDGELRRSRSGRVFVGVCAGLGRHTGIDPLVYRVAFALLTVTAGIGVALYVLGWLLIPGEYATRSPAERMLRRRVDPRAMFPLILVVLVVFLAVTIGGEGIERFVLLAVLLVGVVTARARGIDIIAAVRTLPKRFGGELPPRRPPPAQPTWAPGPQPLPGSPAPWWTAPAARPAAQQTAQQMAPPGRQAAPPGQPWPPAPYPPPQRPPPPPRQHAPTVSAPAGTSPGKPHRRERSLLTPLTVVAAAGVAGLLALVGGVGAMNVPAPLALAAALVAIGLGLILSTWYGRGLILVLAGLAVSVALVATTVEIDARSPLAGGIGDVTWRPASAAEAAEPHQLAAGDGRLDLTALPKRPDPYHVRASVTVGDLLVVVPRDARVAVDANVRDGTVTLPGRSATGPPRSETGRPARMRSVVPPVAEDPAAEKGDRLRVELTLRVGTGEVGVVRAPA